MIRKTTDEIRKLLGYAELDFDAVENEALNAYLPKIFQWCPISEDICTRKQCMGCRVFKDSIKDPLSQK
jgi:hypothetical protein